jgi:hypothetical protein
MATRLGAETEQAAILFTAYAKQEGKGFIRYNTSKIHEAAETS